MKRWSLAIVLGIPILFGACATTKATVFATPRARVTECEELCGSLGLRMSALVIIMNSSGCVCEPAQGRADATTAAGAGTASGGAAIAAAAAQAAAAQQQQAGRR